MDRNINEIFNENSSSHSESRKEKKLKNEFNHTDINNNFYNSLVECLTNEKQDTDKIKVLIILEQDIQKIKDKNKLYNIFRIFENILNDSECINSNILKGQILMTMTTILILINAKDELTNIFLNFVDNILIEHIKNTNNYSNIYLRQIACQCLEELETEYPGILFSLMGKKTIDLLEIRDFNDNDEKVSEKSKKSYRSTRSNVPVFDKKIELENYGLYNLIEEEMFYVFQYYLSLYTTIFKNLIDFYIFEICIKKNIRNDEYKSFFSNLISNEVISTYAVREIQSNNDNLIDIEDSGDFNFNKPPKNNNNASIFNTNFLNLLNNISYFKKFNTFTSTFGFNQKSNLKNDNIQNSNIRINQSSNQINLFQNDKRLDKILHINLSLYNKYSFFIEKLNSDELENSTFEISKEFQSYVNKALSKIIHLLPKTNEMVQTKICKALRFIISKIEINHNALLPHFSYFHLNSNSTILTLTAIKIVENFKQCLKENFILKLVLKLCLLINDLRLNKALRILAIRWLLNLKHSDYNFNFHKFMTIFSYYLCPFPFDNYIISLEKLKTLYLFYDKISENDCKFIMRCISIMDSYKYFPIFSNYVKSLFKAYYFIVLRFPYKRFIKILCEILRNNLKEVPRILPNMINFLRIIKKLTHDEQKNKLNYNIEFLDSALNHKMTFDEIYKYLLIKLSKFIAKFNSHTKLYKYFDLFIEIAKENSIQPQNLIIGLRNLHNSIQDLRNWKIEKNILEVCKYLLKHHDLEIMKQNKIHELLYHIHLKSFDYGIRDKAKLYYKLVTNVEKPILLLFLENNLTEFNSLNISYEYIDLGNNLQNILKLSQSKEERLKSKIEDGGSAFFDEICKQNVMLLSDCNNNFKYGDYVFKHIISPNINIKELNDIINTKNINKLIEYIITPNDTLRLYIDNEMIDDKNDAMIDPQIIFRYDKEFTYSNNEIQNEDVKYDDLNTNEFLDSYFLMVNSNRFYIKLPLDIYMNKNSNIDSKISDIREMYSISICFGKMEHLDIKGPILLPYLEIKENEKDFIFPYFYKIYLIAYPIHPIPSNVEVRAIFYDKNGVCCTGILHTIKIKFEDYFLPISMPPKYRTIYNSQQGKINLRRFIFKKLWKEFKINNDNYQQYVNSYRLIEFDKAQMVNLVFNRLGPFLINENFLEIDHIINNPCSDEYINENLLTSKNTNKIKNFYDVTSQKFKTSSYDFIFDEFLERNVEQSFFAKNGKLRQGNYHLAEVLIFIPKKFHILFKIKISEFSSIVEIRSDCLKIIEYLDDYFDTWIKDKE